MKTLWHRLVLHLFLWSSHKIFPVAVIYSPQSEDADDDVFAMHLATDEKTLYDSCKTFIEEN